MKPSRKVKVNDLITAKTADITRTIKVLAMIDRRVGAAAAREFMKDLTPASECQKLREKFLQPPFFRPKGLGRPTKKDRRDLEKMF